MSVFKCNISYKKVEGDSYTSTYNKLLSQGFIDKYLNVKVDVATWRKGRSELNEQASAKLGQQVNLFDEKILLTGIRAIPNMKLFGMIDQMKKESITNYQPQVVRDEIGIDELGDSDTNNLAPLDSSPIESRIYNSINQGRYSVISSEKVSKVQQQIDEFNELNTGKVLSLKQISDGKYLLNTEYKVNYLYKNGIPKIEHIQTERVETTSNSNFNLPCIK